jgi:hypothetical protein
MQQKEQTKPVRIRKSLLDRLEKQAIKEGYEKQKLTTIAEIVDRLLIEKLNEISPQGGESDTSKR